MHLQNSVPSPHNSHSNTHTSTHTHILRVRFCSLQSCHLPLVWSCSSALLQSSENNVFKVMGQLFLTSYIDFIDPQWCGRSGPLNCLALLCLKGFMQHQCLKWASAKYQHFYILLVGVLWLFSCVTCWWYSSPSSPYPGGCQAHKSAPMCWEALPPSFRGLCQPIGLFGPTVSSWSAAIASASALFSLSAAGKSG